ILGDLSWRSGLFPSRVRTLAPGALSPALYFSVFGVCHGLVRRHAPLAITVLYPREEYARHYLNSFRREPAICGFVLPFTRTHASSTTFSTVVGSLLQPWLRALHVVHA